MIALELQKIVASLSPVEKKHFRLSTSPYEGEKDYLVLFDILCQEGKDLKEAEAMFGERSPGGSFDNTAQYLFKVLTDQLVTVRISQDKWFARHHSFMKARLCFERSLPRRALLELKKTRKLAMQAQDHMLYYQAVREELNYLADAGFPGLEEKDVMDLQMQSRQALKSLHQIHEHHALYELLKLRLLNEQSGQEKDEKVINDLVLGELSIISMTGKQAFESRKTHLLFQSFFLIHTKQYHSALKVFKELNALFEVNEALCNYPPYDNLSALDGILDNLYSMKCYSEMDFFTQKLEQLSEKPFPEHFRNLASQTLSYHRLSGLIGAGKSGEALQFVRSIQETLSLNVNPDKHIHLLLFAALAYFHSRQFKTANQYISRALNEYKPMQTTLIYRTCRLLHVLVHYETDNIDYLDYEIRAYKRFYSAYGRSFKTEKIVFQTVKLDPRKYNRIRKKTQGEKIAPAIESIRQSKGEEPILKYFDFCEWVSTCYE